MKPSRGKPRAQGFTLLEIGIVLAIGAILTTMLAPSVVEALRTTSAERTAEAMWRIQEAGLWGYVDSAPIMDEAHWPGQVDCENENITAQLANQYLEQQFLTNPWGRPYVVTLVTGDGSERRCLMRIWTEIPDEVHEMVYERLRAPKCGSTAPVGSSLKEGFVWCMTDVPPPGRAVELSALRRWRPDGGGPW
jgi:prepilin-type N-terminal cleavage/methylation domain-containing protein